MPVDKDESVLSLRVPRELRQQIVALAQRERRSVNSQILLMLESQIQPISTK